MLRRLHPDQPDSFAFTPANRKWAEAEITKFPEGRQASAIIPLLWRAHEQEGWLTRPAIEYVADMLGMAYIRALEVATFYFQFQLQPVGSVANIQVCGTTTCMICGAEDLIAVCRDKIAPTPHTVSADGKFSWEEVECQGACANAPMAMIGKDYYEDLTADRLAEIIDELAAGAVPVPGPQNGRFSCESLGGPSNLTGHVENRMEHNGSVARAVELGDTVKRIDGTEVPLLAKWIARPEGGDNTQGNAAQPDRSEGRAPDHTGATKQEAPEQPKGHPVSKATPAPDGEKPVTLERARGGTPDNLKLIKGIGPKIEAMLNQMGIYHYDQIAAWSDAEIAWVDQNLEGFRGRISRDSWIAQAAKLASGEETEFAKRAGEDGLYDKD
ncbi:NADH-quinone oxidoreductase subunit NuoE [Pontibaca salina]|uniref:NADH-quinone oxidoreductase subunit NuoE n=1 Tax=Pontibaca salina TaxID=2795731 RepID=A0A934HU21_9RHOB|nr:NADH-quinone oxidoreductase subunit NuoE [Pontibaca salina]MBI6630233.1 NADH-quinone oxidoreductase subunit NuoE [Pontibaca salina]